jgi:hypothetical protein
MNTESDNERTNLIKQLREDSEFLEYQKEELIRIWKDFKGKVVSFYETVKTPTVRQVRITTQQLFRFSAS